MTRPGYDTLRRGTIHCTRWPVSEAIRSKSASLRASAS